MKIRDKLYDINNVTLSRTLNIDDSLYIQIKNMSKKVYNASISEIVNVAIEEYIEKGEPTFYGKPSDEGVTYRNLMIRKNNIHKLNEISKKTGISFTRLVNTAIYEFIKSQK